MKVMIFVKATADSEKGMPPADQMEEMNAMFEEMGKFNEALVDAGIMLDGDGLQPTSAGKRVKFDGTGREVVNGPFANPNDQVAGFWIWNVKDMDEAVEWVKRCPNPMAGPSEIEIRPFYDMSDLAGVGLDVIESEENLRARVEAKRAQESA